MSAPSAARTGSGCARTRGREPSAYVQGRRGGALHAGVVEAALRALERPHPKRLARLVGMLARAHSAAPLEPLSSAWLRDSEVWQGLLHEWGLARISNSPTLNPHGSSLAKEGAEGKRKKREREREREREGRDGEIKRERERGREIERAGKCVCAWCGR